jgi:hypothetical protein
VRRLRRGREGREGAVWTPHQRKSEQRVEHRDGERPESDVTALLLVITPCCKQGSSKANSCSASQIRSSFKRENSLPCSQEPSTALNQMNPDHLDHCPFATHFPTLRKMATYLRLCVRLDSHETYYGHYVTGRTLNFVISRLLKPVIPQRPQIFVKEGW